MAIEFLNGIDLAGDLELKKTDPKIILFDDSGANGTPNGEIVFSEVDGYENFKLRYNGVNDRFEYWGLISNTSTLVGYWNRSTDTSLHSVGTISTGSDGDSTDWKTAYDHSQATHAPSDAEANVQSDWNATEGDSHILNKPTVPSGNSIIDWTADQGSTNIHANNVVGYINSTEPNEPFNPFAGQKFHDGVLTNALAGRHDRFVVTIDGTVEAGASLKLSNQNFEEYNQNRLFGTSAGETKVFNINVQSLASGSPNSSGITYSAGFFDINFYSSPFPASWSARVKNKDGVWNPVTSLTKIGNSKLRGVIPISLYLTDIEFTLTARTSAPFVTGNITYGISEFELFFSRMSASQGGNISSIGGYLGGVITTASGTTSTNWNSAYGWGDHSLAGYSTATGVANNAEVNVQADWNATGATNDALILNKPTVTAPGQLHRQTGEHNSLSIGPGWITVAKSQSGRHHGEVIVSDSESSDHAFIRIDWMRSYADSNFSVLNVGGHANRITGVRVLSQDSDNTYGWKYLQVYVTTASVYGVRVHTVGTPRGYSSHTSMTPILENTKSGYIIHGNALTDLYDSSLAAEEGLTVGGNITVGGTVDGIDIAALAGANTGDQVLPTDFVSAANGGTFSGAISTPTGSTFAGAIKITETGTAQHILIGNQDSGGADKPAMIMGVNGQIKLGYGDSWAGEGGTFTAGLTLDTSSNAIFAGNLQSQGNFTSAGFVQATSYLYLRNNMRLLNKAATNWLTFANRNTTDAEAVYDLANIGTISTSGTITSNGVVLTGDQDLSSYLTSLPAHNHDDRYYTETEINENLSTLQGWVPAYNNSQGSSVRWNFTEDALQIQLDTDTTTGASFKARRIISGEIIRVTIMAKASAAASTGVYFRLYQHNGDMPDGKTHVSNDSANSSVLVQEDDAIVSNWHENSSITTSWVTYEKEYTAVADGYISLVILNWSDLGTNSLYIKNPDIQTIRAANSDLLDGQEGTHYLDYDNFSNTPTLPTSYAPTDAEANVQADWNATSGDAFILNKPSLSYLPLAGGALSGNLDVNADIQGNTFTQAATGIPRNNLGAPTVSEMALFDNQFTPKTTLANSYEDLTDLTFWVQTTSSSAWTEVTTYSDDQKRRFLRTNNSSVIIPNGAYKFRVEFVGRGYTFANAMYAYWSSNSHNTQVHIWKYNVNSSSWLQHTSSSTTVSSWPGHLYLPFSTIPWLETATTHTGHFKSIRIEFTPNWSTGTYSDRNINLSGIQLWGGYPSGRRTVHSYDQNGKLNLYDDLNVPGDITVGGTVDGVDISALPTTFAPTTAEANVQSDWNATSGDALILNKPTIPQGDITSVGAGTNLSGGGTSGAVTLSLNANISLTSLNIGQGSTLQESSDRADLLQITSVTSTWAGLQIRNSSDEGRWSFMTDGSTAGFYDDQQNEWAVQMVEDNAVKLFYNGAQKFQTSSTGVIITGLTTGNSFRTNTSSTDWTGFSRNSAGNATLYVNAATSDANQVIAQFNYGSAAANAGFQVLRVAKDKSYFVNSNLGVGTTDPTSRLTVAGGDVDITDNNILVDNQKGFVNSGAWTRNATPHGYIDIGPANTSHAHIYTDRPNFYFNKEILVLGKTLFHSGSSAIGNLTSGTHGQQMERGTEATTTLRFDADKWRLYAGASAGEVLSVKQTGEVGIGTSAPGTYLQIGDYAGNNIDITTYPNVPSEHMIHLTAPETTGRYGGGISFGENTFTAANITAQDAGSNGSLHMLFGTRHTSGIVEERMRITSSGNVGIGAISPAAKLEVLGVNNDAILTLSRGNASQYLTFRGYQMASNGNNMLVSADDAKQVWLGHQSATSELIIDVGGNVGIGTTSPNDKLHVNGTVRSQAPATSDWGFIGYNSAGTASSGLWFQDGSGDILLRKSDNTLQTRIRAHGDSYINGGYLGIGTTTPDTKLDVISGTNNGIRISATDTTSNWRDITIRSYVTQAQAAALTDHTHFFTTNPSGQSDPAFQRYGGTVIQCRDDGNSNFAIRIGNGNGHATALNINATGVTTFNNTVTATNFILSSDERKKTKIKDLARDNVNVNWKSFELKEDEGEYRTGVVAQELEQSHPEFVKTNDEGFKSVKYIDLLIAKIAELEARLEKLEK